MIELFEKIYETLKNKIGNGLWIDIWNDQVNKQTDNYPLFLPAVFIEFPKANYRRNGDGIQQGNALVIVHVCQNHVGVDTHEGAYNQSFEYLTFVQNVYLALQDLSGDSFSPLDRVETGQVPKISHVIENIIVFSTEVFDKTKYDEYQNELEPVTPDIQPEKE